VKVSRRPDGPEPMNVSVFLRVLEMCSDARNVSLGPPEPEVASPRLCQPSNYWPLDSSRPSIYITVLSRLNEIGKENKGRETSNSKDSKWSTNSQRQERLSRQFYLGCFASTAMSQANSYVSKSIDRCCSSRYCRIHWSSKPCCRTPSKRNARKAPDEASSSPLRPPPPPATSSAAVNTDSLLSAQDPASKSSPPRKPAAKRAKPVATAPSSASQPLSANSDKAPVAPDALPSDSEDVEEAGTAAAKATEQPAASIKYGRGRPKKGEVRPPKPVKAVKLPKAAGAVLSPTPGEKPPAVASPVTATPSLAAIAFDVVSVPAAESPAMPVKFGRGRPKKGETRPPKPPKPAKPGTKLKSSSQIDFVCSGSQEV
jgi:hypothetical protein